MEVRIVVRLPSVSRPTTLGTHTYGLEVDIRFSASLYFIRSVREDTVSERAIVVKPARTRAKLRGDQNRLQRALNKNESTNCGMNQTIKEESKKSIFCRMSFNVNEVFFLAFSVRVTR